MISILVGGCEAISRSGVQGSTFSLGSPTCFPGPECDFGVAPYVDGEAGKDDGSHEGDGCEDISDVAGG